MTEKRKPYDFESLDPVTLHKDEAPSNSNQTKKEYRPTLFSTISISSLYKFITEYPSSSELRFRLLLSTKLHHPLISDLYITYEAQSNQGSELDLGSIEHGFPSMPILDSLQESNERPTSILDNNSPLQKCSVSKMTNSNVDIGQHTTIENQGLTDKEIGQVILRTVELLGVNIEISTLQKSIFKLSISQQLNESIQSMIKSKNQILEWLLRKSINDENNQDLLNLPLQLGPIFSSCYDKTIEQVHETFLTLLSADSTQSVELVTNIINLIESAIRKSEEISDPKSEEDFAFLLTKKEGTNLKQLHKRMETIKEYCIEKSKPVTERKLFHMNEVIAIPEDKRDLIKFIQLTHFEYYDEKFIFLLSISLCAMANSKGGAIFIGIHNIYGRVKGISLWELTNHKLVNEIQRVCTQVSPSLDYEIKIMQIIDQSRDRPTQNVIIRLDVLLRKKQQILFYQRHSNQQFCYVQSNGSQILLNEDQVLLLTQARSQETTAPNLNDYLQFNIATRDMSNLKIQTSNESSQSNLMKVLQEFPVYSGKPQSWILNEQKDVTVSNQKKINESDFQLRTLNRQKSMNRFHTSTTLSENRSNSFMGHSNSSDLSSFTSIGRLGNVRPTQFNPNNQSRFRKNDQYYRNSSNTKSTMNNNNEQKKFPSRQIGRNNTIRCGDKSQQQHLSEINRRISAVNSNLNFKILEGWRRKRLVDFIKNNEKYQTLTEYKEQNSVKSIIDKLNNLTNQNCYLIYNIQDHHFSDFKDKISNQFRQNLFTDFEFIGEIEQLIILKIDRENYSTKGLYRIINAQVVNFSACKFIIHGFTFDYLELKDVFNNCVCVSILEFLFGILEITYELKLSPGKLTLHFVSLIDFIFAYSILIKVKSVFESTIDSKKVKVFFNLAKMNIL